MSPEERTGQFLVGAATSLILEKQRTGDISSATEARLVLGTLAYTEVAANGRQVDSNNLVAVFSAALQIADSEISDQPLPLNAPLPADRPISWSSYMISHLEPRGGSGPEPVGSWLELMDRVADSTLVVRA